MEKKTILISGNNNDDDEEFSDEFEQQMPAKASVTFEDLLAKHS